MTKAISQREARALKRRVKELEQRERALRNALGRDYPGTWLLQMDATDYAIGVLRTVGRLGYLVVAKLDTNDEVQCYAVPTGARANV